MSKAYSDFEWPERISADNDTIDRYLHEGLIPAAPSASDMEYAAEWLALYAVSDETDPALKAMSNVVAFLFKQADAKRQRETINTVKREYAAEHGVSFKQIRIKK